MTTLYTAYISDGDTFSIDMASAWSLQWTIDEAKQLHKKGKSVQVRAKLEDGTEIIKATGYAGENFCERSNNYA